MLSFVLSVFVGVFAVSALLLHSTTAVLFLAVLLDTRGPFSYREDAILVTPFLLFPFHLIFWISQL